METCSAAPLVNKQVRRGRYNTEQEPKRVLCVRVYCECRMLRAGVRCRTENRTNNNRLVRVWHRITQMRPACVLEHHFATFTRSAQWYGPRARQHYGLIKYKRSTVLTPLKARPILKQKTRVSVRNVSRHPR